MYGHEKKESIPTLKSEVLLIRTKCKKRCVKNWPWGKWAGLPVRKSKCARTQMIGWLGTRARPTACSSEFASPYQSLAAWGSAALRGPMTRLPAITCDYKRLRTLHSWDTMFLDWMCRLSLTPMSLSPACLTLVQRGSFSWIALKRVSARVASFHLCLSLCELFCVV